MAGSIIEITTESDLNKIVGTTPNKLTVIDFHATWCGPCKMIAPTFQKLSEDSTYKDVNFLKCDVDKAQDVAQRFSVRVMPTFLFLKGSTEIGRREGANPQLLEATLKEKFVGTPRATAAFSGKGQTLGGTPAPDVGTGGLINLTPQAKVVIGLVVAYALLWYFS